MAHIVVVVTRQVKKSLLKKLKRREHAMKSAILLKFYLILISPLACQIMHP